MGGEHQQPDPGLCAQCAFVHRNETRKGTVYWRCTRALTDPRYPKYPRLPVLSCPGFVMTDAGPADQDAGPAGPAG